MLLMCKNTPVYNIDTEMVYNAALLPGYMMKNPCKATFKAWLKLRYSSNTNSLARQLKGVVFGQGNRVVIDKTTHIFSLSDCYWVKYDNDLTTFEMISPYYTDFWKGTGIYSKGTAIPTLYVGGYLNKEWSSVSYLYKYGDGLEIEAEVSRLCRLCSIPVANVEVIDGGVKILNFTNPDLMLEQADQSGRIDPDDFDENSIAELFGKSGIQMLVIDAIIGNGDRHAGNFGWLRDTDTGAYVSQAPLYDFDHALDGKSDMDRLIQDAVKAVKKYGFTGERLRVADIIKQNTKNDIFIRRAVSLSELLVLV